jgi:tetratricopeptide (TPR) repeat protein
MKQFMVRQIKPSLLKWCFYIVFSVAFVGCSTPAKKSYKNNTIEKLSYTWIKQGDKERQSENYRQAITFYNRGVNYARQRHDIRLASITMLKIAMSYLAMEQWDLAQKFVDEVKVLSQVQNFDIKIALANVEAHLFNAKGENGSAIALWTDLLDSHQLSQEQQFYYQLKIWNAASKHDNKTQLRTMLEILSAKKQQGTLNNIEILSYLYLIDLQWAMDRKNHPVATENEVTENEVTENEVTENEVTEKINAALIHFSELEQTAKLKKIYQLAVRYYSGQNISSQVAFYQNLLEKL